MSMRIGSLGVALYLGSALMLPFTPAQAADVTVTLDAGAGFVVENSTGATERLRVDEATGNISRNGALFAHTTGANNTFVGAATGNLGTSGIGRNTAFGQNALQSNTTGSYNSAFGQAALNVNTTGIQNSGFGQNALRDNTTGSYNSAFGHLALTANTTGQRNAAFGQFALRANTTGQRNSAFGQAALGANTTGQQNAAFGQDALRSNTAGNYNSAFGHLALAANTTGQKNVAFGQYALRFNTAAHSNSAFGQDALRNNSGAGPVNSSYNSAFGQGALRENTSGFGNSGFGAGALGTNTTGTFNSAFGEAALFNSTGRHNSAFGARALVADTTGYDNTAIGFHALYHLTTGIGNIALGARTGYVLETGNDNIYIADSALAAGESNQIRIGTVHATDAFIGGIFGNPVSGSAVVVNANDELGVAPSSIRFKEAVRDMGEASEKLKQLRPVVFRYRAQEDPAAGGDDYGLIAEEVAEVAPELVVNDADGKPYSVRYHVLPAMLLNELQEQQRTIDAQQRTIDGQQRTNDEQQRTIDALLARVAELERPSPADPQVAVR